jgi:hypothetical protein
MPASGRARDHHSTTTDEQGRTVIEYHGDLVQRGRRDNTPALMARWGRWTNIEWIYRVTLGADGRPVSEVYGAPNHATLPFTGVKIDDHPVLRTATANNNMLQVDDLGAAPNRGFLLGESYLPGQPFVAWQGSAVLTPAQPAAVIWSAAGE